ncbi:MAG: helix-turn-helix domain-containing protein [bacterium]
MSTTGQRLKHVRELKTWSQAAVSKITGLSKGTISMAERGETHLTIDNLARMCKALEVSADYVLFGRTSELSDEWRRLSSTEDGLTLRAVILSLYKDKKLQPILTALATLTDNQLSLVLTMLKTMENQNNKT